MTQTDEPFGITTTASARLIGISVSHFYRTRQREPNFPKARYIGGTPRYDPRELRAWFDAQIDEPRERRFPRRSRSRLRIIPSEASAPPRG